MPTPVKTASVHTNFGKAEFRTRKIMRDKVGLHVTIKGTTVHGDTMFPNRHAANDFNTRGKVC